MSFIVKCVAVSPSKDGDLLVAAPPYEDAAPSIGARAYIWFGEREGGQGLAHTGLVRAVGDGKPMALVVHLDGKLARPLRKEDLAPYRDVADGSAIAGLARKVYKHSLQKIASLTAEEDAYLAGHFSSSRATSTASDVTTLEEFIRLENRPGDGRKMFADTAEYRLTTPAENADGEKERKPGTLRGIAAEFIRAQGGVVSGRQLHLHMLKNAKAVGMWDFGYIHSPRATERGWIREAWSAENLPRRDNNAYVEGST